MMSRDRNFRNRSCALFAGVALALTGAALTGCKEEPPPPPPPPPPAPVVRAPEPLRAEDIVTDPRVQFPQRFVPADESLARAVAEFAADLAAGDVAGLESAMDAPSRATLDLLVESGQWTGAAASIQAVRIVRLDPSGGSAEVGLAIQDAKGAYLTGWKAQQSADRWVFGAMPSPPRTAMTAAELDGAALVEQVAEQPKPKAVRAEAPPEEDLPPPEDSGASIE